MISQHVEERLLACLPKIQAKSGHYSYRFLNHRRVDPADFSRDIAQESIKVFLERSEADPAFLDQPDKDIVHRCVLDGWNATRRFYYQEQNHDSLDSMAEYEKATDAIYTAESPALADDSFDPERVFAANALSEQMQEIIARLKPDYQAMCYNLMKGSTREGAMEAIGAKKQAWTYFQDQLQSAFASIAGSPQASAAFEPFEMDDSQEAPTAPMEGKLLKVGPLALDLTTHYLTASGGTPVHLTPQEFALLRLLMQHPKQPIRRQKMCEALGGIRTKHLKSYVARLRKKLSPTAIKSGGYAQGYYLPAS